MNTDKILSKIRSKRQELNYSQEYVASVLQMKQANYNKIENGKGVQAIILTPTRELCVQIAQQFEALGALIGLRTAVLVGGLDMVS